MAYKTIQSTQVFLTETLIKHYDSREVASMVRILLSTICQLSNAQLIASQSKVLTELQQGKLNLALERLLKGEPIQYVIENAWFYGREFYVNTHVLIPRPETEELVDWILEYLRKIEGVSSILDIGTGSACIAISLAKEVPHAEVVAVDIDDGALEVAKKNNDRLMATVSFQQWDVLNKSTWPDSQKYDVIVSNPPYIPKGEENLVGKSVLQYEPRLALFTDDERGMIFYIKIADFALSNLSSGGYLYYELNEFNAKAVVQILESKGFKDVRLKNDLQEKPRMLRARKE